MNHPPIYDKFEKLFNKYVSNATIWDEKSNILLAAYAFYTDYSKYDNQNAVYYDDLQEVLAITPEFIKYFQALADYISGEVLDDIENFMIDPIYFENYEKSPKEYEKYDLLLEEVIKIIGELE